MVYLLYNEPARKRLANTMFLRQISSQPIPKLSDQFFNSFQNKPMAVAKASED